MKPKQLISLHKKIGISSFVIVIILVITGLLLNHTEEFKLHKTFITNKWLNEWYGIEIPQAELGLRYDKTWFSQVANQLYLNQNRIDNIQSTNLIGIEKTPFGWLIATENTLVLLTDETELIDIIASQQKIEKGLLFQQKLVLQLADKQYYQLAEPYEKLTKLNSIPSQAIEQKLRPLPDEIKQAINQQFQQKGLSLERVLLDTHSGRIFGKFGVYVIDIFSILFLILSITGFWLYLKRKPSRRK